MDRRGFLRGTFGGVVAGGVIVAAGIPDTQAFIEQVKVGDPIAAAATSPPIFPDDWMVYNRQGQPIGTIHDYRVEHDPIEIDPSNGYRNYVRGPMRGTMTVKTFGPWIVDTVSNGRE